MSSCSQCGKPVEKDMRFCPNCGAPIREILTEQPLNSVTTISSPRSDEIVVEPSSQQVKQVNSAIPLAEGEAILWHREITHGLIHKEIVSEEAVTNQRCLKYNVENKQVVAQIGIEHRPDVVVMNTHRQNDSLGGGVFLTPRMFGLPGLGGFGVYGGPRRGNIKMFGDVSIMSEGKIVMTFQNVQAPQGLRFLIESLKRERFGGPRNMPWRARRFGGQGKPGSGGNS
jgi:hypothetical protein